VNQLENFTNFVKDLYKSGDIIFDSITKKRCPSCDIIQVKYHICDVECIANRGRLVRCPNCMRIVYAKTLESINESDSDDIVICNNCDYSGNIKKFIVESCMIKR
jgi:hypothetical protein